MSLFKSCIVKNKTNNNLEFVKILQAGEEYQIPDCDRQEWVDDDDVYNAICDGSLGISNGIDYIQSVSEAIRVLHSNIQEDNDGSALSRVKVCTTGWAYVSKCIEFMTGKLDSLCSPDVNGNQASFITIKFTNLDESIEYTTQEDIDLYAVKTIIDIEPPMDIEIQSGALILEEETAHDVHAYALMVPDVPKEYGGCVEFLCSKNIRFLKAKTPFVVNGGAAKKLSYSSVYHSNKIRVVMIHEVGIKVKVQVEFCFFRS